MSDLISENKLSVDDSLILDVVIIVLVIVVLYLVLFPPPRIDTLTYPLKNEIQKALVNPNLMNQSNFNAIFGRYRVYHLREKTFNENFVTSGGPKIHEIATFGTALLSKYAEDALQTEYLTVAEDLIARLESNLQKISAQAPNPAWKPHWREFSVSLTRMLAMYVYLGRNADIQYICHKRITRVTPKINNSMGRTLTGPDLARVAIPRLMTNYLYDRATYNKEIKSDIVASLSLIFNVTENVTENVKDGIYLDGSVISHNVASFEDVLSLADFYAKVYHALGFRTSIDGFLTLLFNDILHADSDFLPFGLFGRAPRVSCIEILATNFPKYKRASSNGVRIFPFCGLGVFKAPKYVFSLRVQRPQIAAYQSDHKNYQYAQGWIQMRKMFHKKVTYGDVWDWETMKKQPGVMRTQNTDLRQGALPAGDEPATFYADSVQAYLGHLADVDDRLMFWMNRYMFKPLFGAVEVQEFGVCTDNGLTMRYVIKVDAPKKFKVRVSDPDVMLDVKLVTDEELHDGCVVFKTDKDFQWRQVFDDDAEPKEINHSDDFRSMEFKFRDYNWKIEAIDDCYYTVRRGRKIVLAGSSRGNVNDRFRFMGETYKRDPNTLMYKPVE